MVFFLCAHELSCPVVESILGSLWRVRPSCMKAIEPPGAVTLATDIYWDQILDPALPQNKPTWASLNFKETILHALRTPLPIYLHFFRPVFKSQAGPPCFAQSLIFKTLIQKIQVDAKSQSVWWSFITRCSGKYYLTNLTDNHKLSFHFQDDCKCLGCTPPVHKLNFPQPKSSFIHLYAQALPASHQPKLPQGSFSFFGIVKFIQRKWKFQMSLSLT